MMKRFKYLFIGVIIGLLISSGVIHSSRMEDTVRAKLLKTGQTTQYSGELDDGYYQKGITKAYTVLTTGQFSGTTNINVIHYTAATISFAATTPGTIADSALGLAMFLTGDIIVITGSASNNGVYTVSTGGVAATIRTTEATVFEAAGATVNIAKREAHSNNCVIDNNTGLMWSRYAADKMGIASDGKMPWTGQLYDIFQYAAAANVAALGGYSDWRVSNVYELLSLTELEQPTAAPDASAFPSWNTVSHFYSSTTQPTDITYAMAVGFNLGRAVNSPKTDPYLVALVRGG